MRLSNSLKKQKIVFSFCACSKEHFVKYRKRLLLLLLLIRMGYQKLLLVLLIVIDLSSVISLISQHNPTRSETVLFPSFPQPHVYHNIVVLRFVYCWGNKPNTLLQWQPHITIQAVSSFYLLTAANGYVTFYCNCSIYNGPVFGHLQPAQVDTVTFLPFSILLGSPDWMSLCVWYTSKLFMHLKQMLLSKLLLLLFLNSTW